MSGGLTLRSITQPSSRLHNRTLADVRRFEYRVPTSAYSSIRVLIVGSAVARTGNFGHLYRFRLNGGRNTFQFDDTRLKDNVADHLAIDDFTTEGEEILFGTNFGIVTDIQMGADGNLYLGEPSRYDSADFEALTALGRPGTPKRDASAISVEPSDSEEVR